MTQHTSVRARFAAAVQKDEGAIDLAEAALLIAAEAYPGLDVAHYTARLDGLAAAARPAVERADSDLARARALLHALAVEHGFAGNRDDYYDRRNSFLNEVLDRRLGIPITLSLVYMEVARRIGLPVVGVGFPGHFLAKLRGPSEIVIDPFFGQILDDAACGERLRQMLGAQASFDRGLLRGAGPREILVRMLRNLKQIHLQAREPEAALACSERILLAEPGLTHELRDRGLLYLELECHAAAQADLERFLALLPDDPSAGVVHEKLVALRRGVALELEIQQAAIA
ncbi:MAG: tetratricopeptide repeat protein, partial [Deltaproteobacteria bacterium]|nr:tetratricopeptide repeat protein [Deltaproteobacteria bacterium]